MAKIVLEETAWDILKVGDIVYERGNMFRSSTQQYDKCLYGPFKVADTKKRELRNVVGTHFLHYPNNLWREVKHDG